MGRLSIKHWILGAAGIAAICLLTPPEDVILYNHSPSMPVGLYWRISGNLPAHVAEGTIVTVRARDVAPSIATARHFDKPNNRFIKHVAAAEGDRVCAAGDKLTINTDQPIARRTAFNNNDRGDIAAIAVWSGCRILSSDEVLLLGDAADSFDGRYWGPTPMRLIEGVWRRL